MNEMVEEPVVPLFSKEYPRSLYNISPEEFKRVIDEIPPDKRGLFGIDEDKLLLELKRAHREPRITDGRLRMKFWVEYDTAQGEQRDLKISAVVGRVCSESYFYSVYAKDPHRLAYLLCIPTDYETQLSETLHFSMREIREILALPNMMQKLMRGGRRVDVPNMKLLTLKTKIHFLVEARKLGSVLQRAEQKNLNVNVDAPIEQAETMNEIELRLKELESKDRMKLIEIKPVTQEELNEESITGRPQDPL